MREPSHSLLLQPGDEHAIDEENRVWVRRGDEFYLATKKGFEWKGFGDLPLEPRAYGSKELPQNLEWWMCEA